MKNQSMGLMRTDLSHSIAVKANFSHAQLASAKMDFADFTDASMQQANLNSADLSGSTLLRADLTGADLRGATLIDTDFTGAILAGATSRRPICEAPKAWNTSTAAPSKGCRRTKKPRPLIERHSSST